MYLKLVTASSLLLLHLLVANNLFLDFQTLFRLEKNKLLINYHCLTSTVQVFSF